MKIHIIVDSKDYRFIDVKKTKPEAEELVKELNINNKEMLGFELSYNILERDL